MSNALLLTAVVSQGQSRNPEKRQVEQSLAERLAAMPGVRVLVSENLYDLQPTGVSAETLRRTTGPLVVFSWLYPRGAFWTLDRFGIRGRYGESPLHESEDDEFDDDWEDESASQEEKRRVGDDRAVPDRTIHCFDLRVNDDIDALVAETDRILRATIELAAGVATESHAGGISIGDAPQRNGDEDASPLRIEEPAARRWYPVIDFSRCTNCMECIDFCLFGVYGIDGAETILVEQPDNCRKGCPACSRVCPENAIIFPQHKTPAIAGSEVVVGGLKIDLSKLFGAPEADEDAATVAARERDEQLVLAGRTPVGATPNQEEPTSRSPAESNAATSTATRDRLDELVDALDNLDL